MTKDTDASGRRVEPDSVSAPRLRAVWRSGSTPHVPRIEQTRELFLGYISRSHVWVHVQVRHSVVATKPRQRGLLHQVAGDRRGITAPHLGFADPTLAAVKAAFQPRDR
jgi:hypothetical protein